MKLKGNRAPPFFPHWLCIERAFISISISIDRWCYFFYSLSNYLIYWSFWCFYMDNAFIRSLSFDISHHENRTNLWMLVCSANFVCRLFFVRAMLCWATLLLLWYCKEDFCLNAILLILSSIAIVVGHAFHVRASALLTFPQSLFTLFLLNLLNKCIECENEVDIYASPYSYSVTFRWLKFVSLKLPVLTSFRFSVDTPLACFMLKVHENRFSSSSQHQRQRQHQYQHQH